MIDPARSVTVHNTDPLGNDGPKTAAPALEVGLTLASGNDTSSAGDRDSVLRPTRSSCCHAPLMRATDLYVVICSECGRDYSVPVRNGYLLSTPQYRDAP